MKRGRLFQVIFRIMGVIVLILGIRMITEGVLNYIEQHKQMDWILTTAEVTDISSRVTSGTGRRSSSETVYDIIYQYEVDGEVYSDELRGRKQIRMVGDDIKIKYDPEMPENSTATLSPSLSDLIVFLIFGAILGVLGFFLSGTYALIRRIRRRGKPEEEEVLPPEEYVKPKPVERTQKTLILKLVFRIITLLLVFGSIYLSINVFPGAKTIDTDQFISAVEAEGYKTTDTTDKLQQDWKVGSMLEEAVSFDDGNIRMDFCVMDTVDSASILYNGMMLPLSEGEKQEYGGIVHEFYSVESNTLYVAKIRIRDTVIYVSAQAEYKAQVVELLETIGYWKE